MLAFLASNPSVVALIIGGVPSVITGLLAYWRAARLDKRAFQHGAIEQIIDAHVRLQESLRADNEQLRQHIINLTEEFTRIIASRA